MIAASGPQLRGRLGLLKTRICDCANCKCQCYRDGNKNPGHHALHRRSASGDYCWFIDAGVTAITHPAAKSEGAGNLYFGLHSEIQRTRATKATPSTPDFVA
jgi:hypothetical protein